jgi:hypothetical protein
LISASDYDRQRQRFCQGGWRLGRLVEGEPETDLDEGPAGPLGDAMCASSLPLDDPATHF